MLYPTKYYSITIERSWGAPDKGSAEREVIAELARISWPPDEFFVHVDDPSLFAWLLDGETTESEGAGEEHAIRKETEEGSDTKTFTITIETGWHATNGEIAEREAIKELRQLWFLDEFTVHVEDPSKYPSFFDGDPDD